MGHHAGDSLLAPAQSASSSGKPKLAPIFAASSGSKRVRDSQANGMQGDSIASTSTSTVLNTEVPAVKKIKTEQSISTLSVTGTSSVASTNTATVVTQSVPEKMSFRWLATNPSRLLHGTYGPPTYSNKLACFDIDGTLIAPASGAKFPKNAQDWKFWCGKGNVQSRLEEYYNKGYSIVFVSNQNYPPNYQPHKNFKTKMPLLGKALGVPFRILAATAKDEYRKPNIGMWNALQEAYNAQGITLDKSQSFYVGDAAGRPTRRVQAPLGNGKYKTVSFDKDHNDTDKGWARNVGITFYTPEEFFWDRKDEQNAVASSALASAAFQAESS